MRVLVVILALVFTGGATQSWAADEKPVAATEIERADQPLRPAIGKRPASLPPLYASLVAVQAADVYTTNRSLKSGGREANPVMGPLAGNIGAVVAVKAAATASTVLLSERLWKRGRRGAAVALMVAANIASAAIAANNVRVTLRDR